MRHQPPNGGGALWVCHLNSHFDSALISADRFAQVHEHCVMPVGLCTQSLYVKKKRVHGSVVPHCFSLMTYRLKNGNVMPHVARGMRRTGTTVPRPMRQDMHLAAMRMSRLRKSFGWRTSMAAVADHGVRVGLQKCICLSQISRRYRWEQGRLLRIWVSVAYNMDCRIRLFRAAVHGFMGPAAPIRYTLMGPNLLFFFSFFEHMYFLLARAR